MKIAGIKSSNNDGFFFPEMVICSYMWVASHGIDVTNNSYFADPWLYNCKNDAEQRAIWKAERRAIQHAQSRAAPSSSPPQGNDSTDLSHPTVDAISPDFPPGSEQEREITNACAVVPVEVPGVVGVTATGDLSLKSFYSSYGISTADVAAPGGDSILQVTPAAPNGRVLSTYPAAVNCVRQVFDPRPGAKYCYLQGTSMAAPHAAGVAALIISQTGKTGGALAAELQQATNPLPCPDTSIYAPFPQNSGEPQSCQGGIGHNSFYGPGRDRRPQGRELEDNAAPFTDREHTSADACSRSEAAVGAYVTDLGEAATQGTATGRGRAGTCSSGVGSKCRKRASKRALRRSSSHGSEARSAGCVREVSCTI